MTTLLKDFLTFLKEYKIISLAIAFVMGAASTSLVNSLVRDIFMPILAPLLPGTSWKEAVFIIGPIHIAYGAFLAEVLNFVILALIIFIIVRKLFKEEEEENKK